MFCITVVEEHRENHTADRSYCLCLRYMYVFCRISLGSRTSCLRVTWLSGLQRTYVERSSSASCAETCSSFSAALTRKISIWSVEFLEMHVKESVHLACCGSGDHCLLGSAVKWLICVLDPDPCLHNALSCWNVGTEYAALVPGKTSLVINIISDFCTILWYEASVTDLVARHETRLW